MGEEFKVAVAPVYSHDAASGKGEMTGGEDVGSLVISDSFVGKKVTVTG